MLRAQVDAEAGAVLDPGEVGHVAEAERPEHGEAVGQEVDYQNLADNVDVAVIPPFTGVYAIANLIADLTTREAELRGYL